MEAGDKGTIVVKKAGNGSFMKSFDREWLEYIGFTEQDLKKDEIKLFIKAEISEHKKIRYIGIGRPQEGSKS